MEGEKSGLDLLGELMEKVDLLSKKIDLLDLNIKKIANTTKAAELINKASEANISGWTKPKTGGQAVAVEAPIKKPKVEKTGEQKPMIFASGKVIITSEGKTTYLSGLTVKIYDKTNKIIKETKTSATGEWRAGLYAGKFVAEITGKYKGQDLTPANKIFEVPEGVKEFVVA